MKTIFLIPLLILATSCRFLDKKIIQESDITPHSTITKQLSEQPSSVIQLTYYLVPFVYTTAFDNCKIDCTEDMVNWRDAIEGQDYKMEMIDDVNWHLVSGNNATEMFFRVEEIP